jgi:predicted ATPase
VDINANCLVASQPVDPDQSGSGKNARNWVIPMYQYQANLIRMCVENSRPCMLYGDVGIGKTTLIDVNLMNILSHLLHTKIYLAYI